MSKGKIWKISKADFSSQMGEAKKIRKNFMNESKKITAK